MKTYGQPCPLARALDLLGDRWTLLIVRELLYGPRKYAQLSEALPGISPSLLTARLKHLEQVGLVIRQVYSERPLRAEYTLTRSGEQLLGPIGAMAAWGSQHAPGMGPSLRDPESGDAVRVQFVRADGQPVEQVRIAFGEDEPASRVFPPRPSLDWPIAPDE